MPDGSQECGRLQQQVEDLKETVFELRVEVYKLRDARIEHGIEKRIAIGIGATLLAFIGSMALWVVQKIAWPVVSKWLGVD